LNVENGQRHATHLRFGQEVEEDDSRLYVTKVAPSPLPGDLRRCAYLQPVS
jgi:hypothetical protein